MSETRNCPSCGAEIASGAPMGLCEACLLKVGLGMVGAEAMGEIPPQATIVLPSSLTEKPGDRIGRYKLLEQIGEGGCGVVYMAEQEEPIRRYVALKVIKPGMDSKQVLARFEAERQALALMDHPNIAKVLDAGATDKGRPYFVMELVKGIPITRFCDENKLSTKARLELFAQVCQAIQHAHQKGVIHRDIKPSNILIADHDGTPVPKIIDFGIAKATTGQTLTNNTLFTSLDQFIGTPAYMSPEQAKLSGLDIDTRSDIYSLGVLLYELLTGKTPFEAKRLFEAGFDEIRRIIREEEPQRPSARISTLDADEQTKVASNRQSQPPKLIHLVRGDLDWIVMKCLEKDRTRRYETAHGLTLDLLRHLNNEPVAASPPSMLYRTQKLLRRRRKEVMLSVAFCLFAALGTVIGIQRQREKSLNRSFALAKMRRQESDIVNRIIANPAVFVSEGQPVVSRLATRILGGEGNEADYELLSRFLTKDVHLIGQSIQEVGDFALYLKVAPISSCDVAGISVLLHPSISMDGDPVDIGTNFLIYLDSPKIDGGTSRECKIQCRATSPGMKTLSCILEAQLIRNDHATNGVRIKIDKFDYSKYQLLGPINRIDLPAVKRILVPHLPEKYPWEIYDEELARQITNAIRGVSVELMFKRGRAEQLGVGINEVGPAPNFPLQLEFAVTFSGDITLATNWYHSFADGITHTYFGRRLRQPLIERSSLTNNHLVAQVRISSSKQEAINEHAEYFLHIPEMIFSVPVTVKTR